MDVKEADQRATVVAEARSWIRTPYHNCADIKGIGVDCGMLIVRVFVDTGLCPRFDPRPYSPDWHLHRADEKYLGFVLDHAKEVDAPQPGDLVVFKFGRCFAHGGIVTVAEPLTFVHAHSRAHCVLEEAFGHDQDMCRRERRFFSFWA